MKSLLFQEKIYKVENCYPTTRPVVLPRSFTGLTGLGGASGRKEIISSLANTVCIYLVVTRNS